MASWCVPMGLDGFALAPLCGVQIHAGCVRMCVCVNLYKIVSCPSWPCDPPPRNISKPVWYITALLINKPPLQDVPMATPPPPEPAVLADFPEEPEERAQREVAFKRDRLPWWVGPSGYLVFTVAGCIALPLLYPPIKVPCSVMMHVSSI